VLGTWWGYVESALIALLDFVSWLLLRLAAIDVSWKELRGRTYAPDETANLVPEADQAEFLFTLQRENSAHTDGKVGQLLTLSVALATVVVVFARDAQPRWLLVFLICALVISVFLCVTALEVRHETLPVLESKGRAAKRSWSRDLLLSYHANVAVHRLRVDRYRAAARYFVVALLTTPVLAALTPATVDRLADIAARLGQLERAGLLVRVAPNETADPPRNPDASEELTSWLWRGGPLEMRQRTPPVIGRSPMLPGEPIDSASAFSSERRR
jgi:hypothetical protein